MGRQSYISQDLRQAPNYETFKHGKIRYFASLMKRLHAITVALATTMHCNVLLHRPTTFKRLNFETSSSALYTLTMKQTVYTQNEKNWHI